MHLEGGVASVQALNHAVRDSKQQAPLVSLEDLAHHSDDVHLLMELGSLAPGPGSGLSGVAG